MTRPEWELVTEGFGRLEGPCLDEQGRLCFSDMRPPGTVYRLEPDGSVMKLADREHVGGLVPHADGGLLASGHTVAVLRDDGTERTILEPVDGWGFNDLATDAAGNVFVGMHGERPTGSAPTVTASLWRVGPGGEATRCYDGVQLTNGLGVSPDGARLYHNDTHPRTVWVSDLDEQGLPVDRRVHAVVAGAPDGMAIDESGCVWVALVDSGRILRLTPDGEQDLVLEAPRTWVASLCFGGADGRSLFAVTFGGDPYDPDHSGAVFRTRVGTAGAAVYPARV
jgi:sugar lactone lactonase YvrE